MARALLCRVRHCKQAYWFCDYLLHHCDHQLIESIAKKIILFSLLIFTILGLVQLVFDKLSTYPFFQAVNLALQYIRSLHLNYKCQYFNARCA